MLIKLALLCVTKSIYSWCYHRYKPDRISKGIWPVACGLSTPQSLHVSLYVACM